MCRVFYPASIPVLVVATVGVYFAQKGVSAVYLTLCLLVLYVGYSMCVLSHAAWGTALVAEYVPAISEALIAAFADMKPR